MIIDCISDLHGFYPKLEGGDLLIVAGDLTGRDRRDEYIYFCSWIRNSGYKKIVVIAGNHDNLMEKEPEFFLSNDQVSYLCDSVTEFEYEEQIDHPASTEHVSIDVLMYQTKKLKIWGSPWSLTFPGMNPHCKAFTCDTEEELAEKWALIPHDTEILICHTPSWGLHDSVDGKRCGSQSLTSWISNHVNTLKLFICGHIHEGYGIYDIRNLQDHFDDMYTTIHVNASHVNERYQPVNKPIRVIL